MELLESARALVEREAPRGPLVLKPLFGSQGKDLRLIHRPEDLPAREGVAGVYYLQRYIPVGAGDFRDYRLFVLRDRVVAAMMRRSSSWITNIKQGGQPCRVDRDASMERLAVAAARAVGAAIAGVDVLIGIDGAPTVLEVNSMPAWSGLQNVSRAQYRPGDRRRSDGRIGPPSGQAPRPVSKVDSAVAAAFVGACLDELDALKPGNVHRFAPGHGMSVAEFVHSAEASAAPIATIGARVGRRIRGAVGATLTAVGKNTNLGIVLLCAPLAAAAELKDGALRQALEGVLDRLDREDAADAFAAIAAANPGGLGRAVRHDVRSPVTGTLLEAMAEAAGRDRIARQYVTAYEDIFSLGLPALEAAQHSGSDRRWSTLAVYLSFLADRARLAHPAKIRSRDRRGDPARCGPLARRARGDR